MYSGQINQGSWAHGLDGRPLEVRQLLGCIEEKERFLQRPLVILVGGVFTVGSSSPRT